MHYLEGIPMPYTSIPTEIEAVQTPNDYAEFNANGFLNRLSRAWGPIVEDKIRFDFIPHLSKHTFRVLTNHGIVEANEGDYIIKNGDEVYPCKAEVFKAKYRVGSNNNVLEFSKKGSTNQDADEALNSLKKAISSKAIIVASVNEDGSFDSFVSDEVRDIDFCYAIDCLKERRSLRLKEIRS